MKANDLIGKLAIRTQGAKTNYGVDNSYTSTPIRILAVTDHHIVYDYVETFEEKTCFEKMYVLLNENWNDNNWTDYNELMQIAKKNKTAHSNILQ